MGKLISKVSIPWSSPLLTSSERVCESASPGPLLCFPTPTGFGLGGVQISGQKSLPWMQKPVLNGGQFRT